MGIVKPNIRELTLKHGISYPSDAELLMLILGSGTKDVSVDRLSKTVVRKLSETNCENLIQTLLSIKGMGESKALAVAAAIEFGRRKNCHNTAKIINPRDVVPFVRSYSVYQKEYFLTVTEIFSEAIKENAAAIIVCHNHPSGNCTPSDEDIKTTSVLMEAADILGIALLDHVIFDKTSYFSFVENGLLFNQ